MIERFITILAVIVVVLGTSTIGYIYYDQWRGEPGLDDAVEDYGDGNYRSAFVLFRRLARDGNTEAQRYLAYQYEHGLGTEADIVEAFNWRLRLADRNDADSMYWVANAYESGTGTLVNFALGIGWYRRAAAQGHIDAQAVLGARLVSGGGVAADPGQGLPLLMQAVDAGNSWAMAQLGEAYRDGSLGKMDYDLALSWCLKSIRAGSFAGYECTLSLLENKHLPIYDLEQAYVWSLVARHWWQDDESINERLDYVIPGLLRHRPVFQGSRIGLITGATELVDGTSQPGDQPETWLEFERRSRDFESWPIRLAEEARVRAEAAAEDILARWPEPPIVED